MPYRKKPKRYTVTSYLCKDGVVSLDIPNSHPSVGGTLGTGSSNLPLENLQLPDFGEDPEYDHTYESEFVPLNIPTSSTATPASINYNLNRDLALIWVCPDGREAHYLQPQYSFETGEFEAAAYSFVALRQVEYSGGPVLVGWCSNARCPDHTNRAGLDRCFQGADFPDQEADQNLAGIKRLCCCSERVVACKRGEEGLKSRWRRATASRVRLLLASLVLYAAVC